MVTTTMGVKTMTKKTRVTNASLSSHWLGPSFTFRRNWSNLMGRNTRRGEGRALPSIPEAGWDKDTEEFERVLDYTTSQEVRRRIAFTTRMSRDVPSKKANYSNQKILNEGDDVAAGHIQLEPETEKPNKSLNDNSCVFFPSNDVWSICRSR